MEWFVFRHNINARRIEKFNIFDHAGFSEDFEKLKHKRLDRDRFAKELNSILMYYFCSRYEYEIVVSELTSREERIESKVDIYEQIKMNWDQFLDYATGRASPCQIGEKLWYSPSDGGDPFEVTVCMMTQKADKTWKIRVNGKHSWEIHECDIGRCLFRDQEAAKEVSARIKFWSDKERKDK